MSVVQMYTVLQLVLYRFLLYCNECCTDVYCKVMSVVHMLQYCNEYCADVCCIVISVVRMCTVL